MGTVCVADVQFKGRGLIVEQSVCFKLFGWFILLRVSISNLRMEAVAIL